MRHRIKKIPTLSTLLRFRKDNEYKLLHSDKSTHFYNKLSCFSSKNGINPQLGDEDSVNPTSPSHETRRSSGLSLQAEAASSSGRYPADGFLGKARLGLTSTLLVVPAFAFLLVLGFLLNPTIGNPAYAEEGIASQSIANPDASIAFSISNNGNTVNDGDTVNTEVTSGVVSYISNDIAITTKDINRFYVTVQATSDGTSELIGTEHKATIAPVGNNVNVSNFGDNTWGYALTDSNVSDNSLAYSSLPAYNTITTPQYTSSNDTADNTYHLKLTFAAKINGDKPADHYTTKAMVSIAADAKMLPTLMDLTYMQEATPEICNRSSDLETKQLIDGRDNKSYWVTKIAGTCWMTQDLDLDLGPDGPVLTTDNTDYRGSATAWTGGASVASSSSGWPTNDYTTVNWYERDTAHGTEHTSLGNLYSYEAATAGTGHTVTSDGDEAPGSICPAGWKLPLGSSSTATGSFDGLGLTISNKTGDPYYFQYGSSIIGSLNVVGSYGVYWSATSINSDSAYNLYFVSSSVYPANGDYRYLGMSVRCVVR